MLNEYMSHWDQMIDHAKTGDYDKAAESELKYYEERIKARPSACRERPNIPSTPQGRKRHYGIYLQMEKQLNGKS